MREGGERVVGWGVATHGGPVSAGREGGGREGDEGGEKGVREVMIV